MFIRLKTLCKNSAFVFLNDYEVKVPTHVCQLSGTFSLIGLKTEEYWFVTSSFTGSLDGTSGHCVNILLSLD